MSEISHKEQAEAPSNSSAINASPIIAPNELKKSVKIQELPSAIMNNHVTPAGISRERSFVRSANPQSHQVSFKIKSFNRL
jgi:hypothetical protein